ncbi:hypothetical protein [Amycolatopsis sp. NBC_01480]|uniref:hypothetical protein n=1 Tax=Amycolatopsis sp. NBC_01480 TaxID=2903562 RepID=UPI002E2AEF81|nr:hypothetical protein [Amycolatopsis sp. NBC_01480]
MSRGLISRDLLEYGEGEASDWALTCSNDELMRICGVAEWLLLKGPSTPSGGSMMLATASSLAAVFVHEGHPRKLKRARRKKLPELSNEDSKRMSSDGLPDLKEQDRKGHFYGMSEEAEKFWEK